MRYLLILSICFFSLFASDAFISSDELKKSFTNKNTVIIDVADFSIYQKSHIKGAIHADISRFINQKNPYSCMNSPKIIQEELTNLGINKDSKVIIYSHNTEKGILNSSYLALVLIYGGFNNFSILDGGYMAWIFENEFLTSTSISDTKDGNFILNLNPSIFTSVEHIQNNLALITMLDARSSQLYYGTQRSNNITSIGHISFAKSSFYKDKFLRDSTLRKQSELDEIYIYGYELKIDDEIIVYSDTVFSASMEFYILYKHMGFKNTKLYENSLLEWGNTPNLPMTRFKWE